MQQSTGALRRTTGPNWRTLKLMAGLLKVIASLIVLAGIALAVVLVLVMTDVWHLTVLLVSPQTALPISIVYLVSTLLGTVLSFLFLTALAELLLLLIALEYNTRQRHF